MKKIIYSKTIYYDSCTQNAAQNNTREAHIIYANVQFRNCNPSPTCHTTGVEMKRSIDCRAIHCFAYGSPENEA